MACVAQFDSGFRAAFRAEMEIVGTEGSLRVERAFKGGPDSRAGPHARRRDHAACRSSLTPPTPAKSTTSPRLPSTGNRSALSLAESRRTDRRHLQALSIGRHRQPVRLYGHTLASIAERLHAQVGQPFQIARTPPTCSRSCRWCLRPWSRPSSCLCPGPPPCRRSPRDDRRACRCCRDRCRRWRRAGSCRGHRPCWPRSSAYTRRQRFARCIPSPSIDFPSSTFTLVVDF